MDQSTSSPDQYQQTLVEAALQVLNTADPVEKARLGDAAAKRWLRGQISTAYHPFSHFSVPDRPARSSNVKLVSPQLMPKLGKAGSLQSRQAILHSLVHTESWAIDLSWARGLDVLPTTISRFRNGGDDCTADLLETVVYPEEITHCAAGVKWFKYLCIRSMRRSNSLSTPGCSSPRVTQPEEGILEHVESFNGDFTSPPDQAVLNSTANDELETVIRTFHATVRTYFRGPLKRPFNEQARKAAGFGPQWYEPLAVKGS